MKGFDPTSLGFTLLKEYRDVGNVAIYERTNHPCVDGSHDFLRINTYLSKDNDYVTIWWGLLDAVIAEGRFDLPELLASISFYEQYTEMLFRGYIEDNEAGAVILRAFRFEKRYGGPQILRGAPHDLRCEILE